MGRTGLKRILLWFLVYVIVISVDADYTKHVKIWPLPNSLSYGSGTLYLSNDFVLKTDGSKFIDNSGILKDAFLRTLDVIQASHAIEANTSGVDPSLVLEGIHVVIASPSDEVLVNNGNNFLPNDCSNPPRSHYRDMGVPARGWVKLNCDGSCLGNPGASGGGGIIRDEQGNFRAAYAKCFGTGTNNSAELRAVIEGLRLCQEQGWRQVIVRPTPCWWCILDVKELIST